MEYPQSITTKVIIAEADWIRAVHSSSSDMQTQKKKPPFENVFTIQSPARKAGQPHNTVSLTDTVLVNRQSFLKYEQEREDHHAFI